MAGFVCPKFGTRFLHVERPYTIVLWVWGVPHDAYRDASLSDSCTSDRGCFFLSGDSVYSCPEKLVVFGIMGREEGFKGALNWAPLIPRDVNPSPRCPVLIKFPTPNWHIQTVRAILVNWIISTLFWEWLLAILVKNSCENVWNF